MSAANTSACPKGVRAAPAYDLDSARRTEILRAESRAG